MISVQQTEDVVSSDLPNEDKKSNKVLSVIGIIVCIILLPVLILNIILIIQGFNGDKSVLPNVGGYFPLMVQSGSMSPTIEVGDLLIVHTTDDASNMKVGDVVTYWDGEPGGALVTHRIHEVTKDKDGKLAYRTKGDYNAAVDSEYLYPEGIVGVYVTRVPVLGDVAMFMQTIPGLIVCVVLPLAIFIIYDVIRRRKIDKSNKEETDALLAELEELKKLRAEKEAAAASVKKAEAEEKSEDKNEESGKKSESSAERSEGTTDEPVRSGQGEEGTAEKKPENK